jgi:DNA-3-methyladenine glycosylase I
MEACRCDWCLVKLLRAFEYIGEITMYAHMQAVGVVNNHLHLVDCFRHKEVSNLCN